jgi:hypothetical protein
MKKVFKNYGWLLKFIAAALILALGIVMKFVFGAEADTFVLIFTGFVFVILGLYRIIPLLKTLHNRLLKVINLIEIIFDVVIGAIMLFYGLTEKNPGSLYGYMLGSVLYVRAIVYLVSVVLVKETTDQFKFWFHLALFTLGVVVLVKGDIGTGTITWIIFGMSLVVAGYLSFDGGAHYKRYRYETNPIKVKVKENNKKKEEVIVDPVITPDKIDEPKKDNSIVQ